MKTINLDEVIARMDTELLAGIANIKLNKKDEALVQEVPTKGISFLQQKYEAMLARVDREEILEYIIYLENEGYSKNEIIKLEEDFEYLDSKTINEIIGFKHTERNYCFKMFGQKSVRS